MEERLGNGLEIIGKLLQVRPEQEELMEHQVHQVQVELEVPLGPVVLLGIQYYGKVDG